METQKVQPVTSRPGMKMAVAVILAGGLLHAQSQDRTPQGNRARAEKENVQFWNSVFSGNRILRIHFHLTRQNWDRMMPEESDFRGPGGRDRGRPQRRGPGRMTIEYEYVPAVVEVAGHRLENIGLRYKGNSSFRASRRSLKRPLKMDTNRFEKGVKLFGRTKLNFSTSFHDPSFMKEKLAFEVFRAAGIPTPGAGWAQVTLTVEGLYKKKPLGLYVIVEQMDRKYIRRKFGADSDGSLLMKPEGVFDWEYLGKDPGKYHRYGVKSGKKSKRLIPRFAALLRLIQEASDSEFTSSIAKYLDLEAMAGYLAANALMTNLDSYAGSPHNYYILLDRADLRVKILPWDLNESFGGFGIERGRELLVRWDIKRPWTTRRRLLERLFEMTSFRKRYEGTVARLLEKSFSEAFLFARIDAWKKILEPVLMKEPGGKGVEGLNRGIDGGRSDGSPFRRFWRRERRRPLVPLKPFLRDRILSATRQLAGTEKGVKLEHRRMAPPRSGERPPGRPDEPWRR